MTSRRSRLIEDGARELLQFHGYKVRVLPEDSTSGFPRPISSQPGHLGGDAVHPDHETLSPVLLGADR